MKNEIHSVFDAVHAEETLKENTKLYIKEQLLDKNTKRNISIKRLVTAFACFFLIFFAADSYFSQTAAISIDINPSIEISINRFNRVIDVKGYNKETQDILEPLDLTHLKYEDALNKLMNSKSLQNYLNNDAFISVTILAQNSKKNKEIQTTFNEMEIDSKQTIHCYRTNKKLVSEAHKTGLSFGKYRAYLDLKEINPNITIDMVKKLSMRQIQDLIDQPNQTTESDTNKKSQKNRNSRPEQGTGQNQNSEPKQNAGQNQNCEPNQGTGQNQNPEPKQGTGQNQNTEPKQGTGQSQNPEPKQGAGQNQNSEPKQGTGQNQNSEPKQGTGQNQNSESKQGTGQNQNSESKQGTGQNKNSRLQQ